MTDAGRIALVTRALTLSLQDWLDGDGRVVEFGTFYRDALDELIRVAAACRERCDAPTPAPVSDKRVSDAGPPRQGVLTPGAASTPERHSGGTNDTENRRSQGVRPDLSVCTGTAVHPDGARVELQAGPSLGASASDLRKRAPGATVTNVKRTVLMRRAAYDARIAAGETREQIIESVTTRGET